MLYPAQGNGTQDHWRRWLLLIWLLVAIFLITYRWQSIDTFSLSDTDDNMRLAQVRAWMAGQGWFDLRQYKLDPPGGADIHWSRLVDLPLAAIIWIVKPFFGTMVAEKAAIGLAPLLPLGIAFFGVSVAVRRLITPAAWPFAAALLICASASMTMFMPTRIDHHGWQIALLAMTLAGLVDHRQARGGMTVGAATAGSLVIGLEMLPYLAIGGAAVTLRWIWDRTEVRRLRAYAVTLGGGTAFGYMVFGSFANGEARCDALSPVWLSVMALAGALLLLLSFSRNDTRITRLALATVAGGIVAASIAYFWPHCIGRPEGISPELEQLWFKNIREVKPLYEQKFKTSLPTVALPLIGLAGSAWAMMKDRSRAGIWAPVTLFSACSCLLLFWQTRAGPAAQLLAIPGAAALAWAVLPRMSKSPALLIRTLGVVAAFLLISGLAVQLLVGLAPIEKPSPALKLVNAANAKCATLSALDPIARLPAATILTFVDMGPRLITVTPHKAIAGPYHRNGGAIIDVHHAFGGAAEDARTIARKHGATMILLCPEMSESTIYRTRNPKGFYVQLMRGRVPAWLSPVALPDGSPFKLWQIIG